VRSTCLAPDRLSIFGPIRADLATPAVSLIFLRATPNDENRRLDVKKEVNFPIWSSRFVRDVDGAAVSGRQEKLTVLRDLSAGIAVRHFNVMHHMMKKAATIWSQETGIERNPACLVEVKRPDDQRDRTSKAQASTRMKRRTAKVRTQSTRGSIGQADCVYRRYHGDACLKDFCAEME
jgi:hypothetical protein